MADPDGNEFCAFEPAAVSRLRRTLIPQVTGAVSWHPEPPTC